MGKNTKIGWTDHTFNYVWGCDDAPADEVPVPGRTAPECLNCYARMFDKRIGGDHWGATAPRRRMSDSYWAKPLRWNAAAEARGVRETVFCSSMADVFEVRDDEVGRFLDEQRERLWDLIRRTPWLDWQLLTKRIVEASRLLPWLRDGSEPWPNVWVGTTCGARSSLWRVRRLREIHAVVLFVSGEPLVEHISGEEWDEALDREAIDDRDLDPGDSYDDGNALPVLAPIDQLIIGDESGPHRRSAQLDWIRTAREAAARNGVAFFLKQWNGPLVGGISGDRKGERGTVHLPVLDGRTHDARPRR